MKKLSEYSDITERERKLRTVQLLRLRSQSFYQELSVFFVKTICLISRFQTPHNYYCSSSICILSSVVFFAIKLIKQQALVSKALSLIKFWDFLKPLVLFAL